jgi:hypothetical protein
MAITNIYQDLIMNPENMPNRLQNLEMFPPVDNIPSRIDFITGDELVPGMGKPAINFKDAPVPFGLRKNNPFRGPIDSFILSRGNPDNNIINRAKSAMSSGFGKGVDLGKAAIGGIASLLTGIPGIGLLANVFGPMSPEEKAMRDFYEDQFGLTDTGQIASGIMQGYNPVSLTGFGLSGAIDKRIARINKTLDKQRKDKKRKESNVLKKRLKELESLKARESAAAAQQLESQRRGRRPGTGGGGEGRQDSGGPTGGYSYDAGGRQGFGYGLKEGGIASL